MMPGRRSEVPQDGLIVLRKERKPVGLVLRPGADVSCRQVPHIIHVEAKEGSHLRLGEKSFGAAQALASQTVEVDTVFPINRHRSVGWQSHTFLLRPDLLIGRTMIGRTTIGRRVPEQPQTRSALSARSHLLAEAKKESEHASPPCASPARPNCRMRPWQSPRQVPR